MYWDTRERNYQDLKNKVIREFFLQMLICVIGMVLGMKFIPPELAIMAGIGAIVVLIGAAIIKIGKPGSLPRFVCNLVAFLLGVCTYPSILYYVAEIGALLVLVAFGITTIVFGSLAIYSYKSKKDFTFLGGTLFAGLLGLLIISLVGVFFIQAEIYYLVAAWLGVFIFSGYVLYDVSKIKFGKYGDDDVPALALNLFLDFLNLFLDILRIVAAVKKRR